MPVRAAVAVITDHDVIYDYLHEQRPHHCEYREHECQGKIWPKAARKPTVSRAGWAKSSFWRSRPRLNPDDGPSSSATPVKPRRASSRDNRRTPHAGSCTVR